MAFMVTYDEPSMTQDLYEAVRGRVDWEKNPPPGALLHLAAFDKAGGIHVVDVWETEAQCGAYLHDRFNPALLEVGLPPAAPKALDLHVMAARPGIENAALLVV
jgi:hypothetical protein